jgi:MFS family permease
MSGSKYSVSVLKLRNFRMLLMTRMFIMMALQAQSVIVGWQIYSLTKSTFLLGLTGLVEAVPAIACALFAGHVVDSSSHPRKIYILCIGTLALNTIMLLVFAGGIVPLQNKPLLYLIYGGIFLSGLARSFTIPSSFTLLSQIVKREEMPSAAAWLGTGFQISAIAGPAVAGLVYGGYGPDGGFCLPCS